MSWKKRQPGRDHESLDLDFELDRRHYFRVKPAPDQPVRFCIDGREYAVEDLSAGGLALAQPGLPSGRRMKGELWLPKNEMPITVSLMIVRSALDRPTSCNIEEISERGRESLHQYVLQRQKTFLDEKKALEAERLRSLDGKLE